MSDPLALDIARAWDGRNHFKLAAQFGLSRRCIYLAITMLYAERDWLLSLQAACVEFSPAQTARLAVLLDRWPQKDQSQQDRAFRIAGQTPLERGDWICPCLALRGGNAQSTSRGSQL